MYKRAIIKLSGEALAGEKGFGIDQSVVEYVVSQIKKVTEMGPYIVIAPNIAIPHAQEGYGVHDTAVCFMRTERPVSFSDDGEYDARLFFVLASVNNDEHLKNLVEMSDALSDEDYVEKLLACKTAEDLLKLEGV